MVPDVGRQIACSTFVTLLLFKLYSTDACTTRICVGPDQKPKILICYRFLGIEKKERIGMSKGGKKFLVCNMSCVELSSVEFSRVQFSSVQCMYEHSKISKKFNPYINLKNIASGRN